MLEAALATAPEVATHLTGGRGVAVLPFGALEQHGPHLPLSTDTLIAESVARGVADALDALLLPAIPCGETWLTAGYPGTVSLGPETVSAIAVDIGRGVAASGARALVVVNGDFGNRAPLHRAVRTVSDDGAIVAIVLDLPGLNERVSP